MSGERKTFSTNSILYSFQFRLICILGGTLIYLNRKTSLFQSTKHYVHPLPIHLIQLRNHCLNGLLAKHIIRILSVDSYSAFRFWTDAIVWSRSFHKTSRRIWVFCEHLSWHCQSADVSWRAARIANCILRTSQYSCVENYRKAFVAYRRPILGYCTKD